MGIIADVKNRELDAADAQKWRIAQDRAREQALYERGGQDVYNTIQAKLMQKAEAQAWQRGVQDAARARYNEPMVEEQGLSLAELKNAIGNLVRREPEVPLGLGGRLVEQANDPVRNNIRQNILDNQMMEAYRRNQGGQ